MCNFITAVLNYKYNVGDPPCGHVFQQTGTIFELIQDIVKTNGLTKVFTSCKESNILGKIHPPLRPCFSTNRNNFELVLDIIGSNFLSKLHEDRTINVAS
ncbi:hypothetical protein DPMN_119015 [Dreissena polymorpha]|uniref:Uncharacterized protein n=1 Tax=Dreissena polymorpha TaxID=45954 RepID=A0A9D4GHW8_DREPO|nr:hypothetical protein DPMN_119015 [Dreissena polymorpha]